MSEVVRLAGEDCLNRVRMSSVWGWEGGSRPFFWRWPEEFQSVVLHGQVPWLSGKLKPYKVPQSIIDDEVLKRQVGEKLKDVSSKNYIEDGKVRSLMFFFAVPKGEKDIRMVYDGTKSGLNEVLWAPWFPLPTVWDMLDSVEEGTWLCDNDVGEMFLNFVLHDSLRELCGIDVSQFWEESDEGSHTGTSGKNQKWLRWARNAMGLKCSPYFSTRIMSLAMEAVTGDRKSETNIFRWDRVILNLPGSGSYDPSKSWVRKVRKDGTLAAGVSWYVDDLRPTGPSRIECWKAAQRISSILASKGIQDASRKRREASQQPGSWAGADVHTSGGEVTILISQERWDKCREILKTMQKAVLDGKWLDHKQLLSDRGKLVYALRNYWGPRSYLKGIHLTADSWREGRSKSGWKTKRKRSKVQPGGVVVTDSLEDDDDDRRDEWEEWEDEHLGYGTRGTSKLSQDETRQAPSIVRPVPRLASDLEALVKLFERDKPAKVKCRSNNVLDVVYGFGDASGIGFGSSIRDRGGNIVWQSGTWNRNSTTLKDEIGNSNFRELLNLVIALERAEVRGLLESAEVFMFTDNTTAERAFFKSTSKSRALFELVLRLRLVEQRSNSRLYVIHVAGTRMIEQGTDGLSRGDMNAGVMIGNGMLNYVPLAKSALERGAGLREWILSWAHGSKGKKPIFLEVEEWFGEHREGECYVWSPAPAAGRNAVFQASSSIHKRCGSVHVVIIPRLMTSMWRKQLGKATDTILTLPIDTPVWSSAEHEPLIIAIYFPLSQKAPWRYRGTDLVVELEASVQGLWKTGFTDVGPVLRKCIKVTWGKSGRM